MRLSDQVIAEIAKLIQVAMLTGTDIVDNLRMLEVEETNNHLTLTEQYVKMSEGNIERMLEQVKEMHNGTSNT
jgi:hypothetical protein